jgi:hypothetical protein
MEILIKCKSKLQAVDIVEHFIGSRPSEEFLNDRLFEGSGETLDGDNVDIDYHPDIIIINLT